jgi:hypothetical protein
MTSSSAIVCPTCDRVECTCILSNTQPTKKVSFWCAWFISKDAHTNTRPTRGHTTFLGCPCGNASVDRKSCQLNRSHKEKQEKHYLASELGLIGSKSTSLSCEHPRALFAVKAIATRSGKTRHRLNKVGKDANVGPASSVDDLSIVLGNTKDQFEAVAEFREMDAILTLGHDLQDALSKHSGSQWLRERSWGLCLRVAGHSFERKSAAVEGGFREWRLKISQRRLSCISYKRTIKGRGRISV